MVRWKILGAFILYFFILTSLISGAEAADWKLYGKMDPFIEYYDAGSLSYPTKDVVRVQLRSVCSDKNKCKELHKKWIRESKGQMDPAYEKWAYRLSFAEIQCRDKKIRFLSAKNVDENGKTIDDDVKPTEWMDIKNPWNQPDPLEDLWKIICK
jgi:hypothetical protein